MAVLWPNGGTTPTPEASGIRCTSEFGWRTHPVTGQRDTFHYGLDQIGWSIIIAPVTGTVTFAGYNGGAGNEVRIKADNGDVFRLLHNRELWVKTGQRVSQGQQVAVMGTTGSSTGVHCHEETRPGGGDAINPRDYYARANGGGPTPSPQNNEEDNIMLMIKLKGARVDHVVALGEGIFRHFVGTDPYEFIKNVSRSADDWQDVNFSALPALLRTYGCDLNIWDFRDARDLSKSVSGGDANAVFCVLDPLDGSVKPGNMWSSAGATRRAIADLAKSLGK